MTCCLDWQISGHSCLLSEITYCWSSISSPIRTNEDGCSVCGNELSAVISSALAAINFRLVASRLAPGN